MNSWKKSLFGIGAGASAGTRPRVGASRPKGESLIVGCPQRTGGIVTMEWSRDKTESKDKVKEITSLFKQTG